MYRIESSGPCSDPVEWGLPERGVSPVCGHPVFWCPDGYAGLPGGELVRRFELCQDCEVERAVVIARGDGAELFLHDCERLALRPFNCDPDDYTVHEFWITWCSGGGGRSAAIAEALSHGYRLPALN